MTNETNVPAIPSLILTLKNKLAEIPKDKAYHQWLAENLTLITQLKEQAARSPEALDALFDIAEVDVCEIRLSALRAILSLFQPDEEEDKKTSGTRRGWGRRGETKIETLNAVDLSKLGKFVEKATTSSIEDFQGTLQEMDKTSWKIQREIVLFLYLGRWKTAR